jgi:GDP-4-dehydro-6-deoxy-D-mannose reductase
VNVLVTGANGFVGRKMVARLLADGHRVTGAVGGNPPGATVSGCQIVEFDITRDDVLSKVDIDAFDAVVHLAAVASSSDACRNPAAAWEVNVVGSVRLLEAFGSHVARWGSDTVFLLVSSCDVYGPGTGEPLTEDSPTAPVSSYAASKLGAEVAAAEVARRTGLRVITVRPFPHSGAGQDARFVVPDFARKILSAKAESAPTVAVGDLRIERELLHVGDVVDAYARLLDRGRPGEVYNVARGESYSLGAVYDLLCQDLGYRPEPRTPPDLVNQGPPIRSIGDAARLRRDTGWEPSTTFSDTVSEVAAAALGRG